MHYRNIKPIIISLLAGGLGLWSASAATYKEVGGVVSVEAEHFDSRTKATDDDHEWKIAPDELSADQASANPGQYQNARGGKYMTVLPDAGQNRNNADAQALGPYVDYKVQIDTTGEYRMWLRTIGFDGASDSGYVSIVELKTDNGGSGPNWYRKAPTPNAPDFDLLNDGMGWDGNGGAEQNSGDAGGNPMLWTIAKAGVYTVRFQQREDGHGFDAFVLQLNSKPDPTSAIVESGQVGQLDTDKDGMSDTYEIAHGFNPNDASDAAKDFDGDGVSNLDEYKAGTDPSDVTKPAIVSASTTSTFDTIKITFSEEVDPATATAVGNYTITPSLGVTAATIKKRVVTLTTAKQTPGATAYTVAVKGVKDTSKNEVSADSKAVVYSYILSKSGALKFSLWKDIPGTPLQGLFDDPRYPKSPDSTGSVFSFNSREILPTDSLENYGATIEGFLTPLESASYRFFTRSDDPSQVFLSTDDKEANLSAAPIAEETGCCNAFTEPDSDRTSEPIALVAGKKYFIRGIYKEGGGGDYIQVAWRKEGDKTPAGALLPIPNQFLSAAEDLPAPAEGAFQIQQPAPNAKNVSPATGIRIGHRDGKTPWTSENVSLKFDGAVVKPKFTKEGNLVTIESPASGILSSKSTHTISLSYPDPGGKAATLEWSFEVAEYRGPVKDVVKGYNAILLGKAVQTADKGGASGLAGDKAIDLTTQGGPVQPTDSAFLSAVNAATGADELSLSLWVKKYDIAASSAFWFSSPSQDRVFQAHIPWSDNTVYFDTAGCCGGDTRTQEGIASLLTYTGDATDIAWWKQWRHFVFTKAAAKKQIYIDGVLFKEGDNDGKLSTDISQLMIGSDNGSGNKMHGLVDDFAVFSKALTAANVTALKGGTKPSALPAAAGLLAYWDFDKDITAPSEVPKFTSIQASGGNVTVTWTGGGVLQAADTVNGPYTDVAGAKSPFTIPASETAKFARVKQ